MRSQTGETGRGGGGHHTQSRSVDTEVVGGAGQPLYKLHGTNRPLSMKSDVVRKRSRHELKRAGLVRSSSEIPSASPGASRRASPVRVPSPQPTIAAEDEDDQAQEEQKTPQFSYDYTSSSSSRTDFGTKESSNANDTLLSSTISQEQETTTNNSNSNGSNGNSNNNSKNNGTTTTNFPYMPGPYHPDYLYQYASSISDLPPIQTSPNGETSAYSIEDRGNKRRRLSSASHDSSSPPTDPPPSATSVNSSNRSPGASPTFSVYSLPFSSIYSSYDGYENMSWEKPHPPMVLPDQAPSFHPPMAFASESPSSSSNSFIHPPMLPSEDVAMSYYNIHPPMLPPANSPTGFNNQNMQNNYINRDDPNNMFDSYNIYNDATNSIVEMFETMMQPMD
ncbi:hypothetical protein Clacol_003475 [Clathrus columnatus]|uniref:Uncharacterized protein n=1 Tax=Clathrus columnatus TaxID=1419009 RepID=A0AAV5A9B9_9AGAM|nr:hypothetical protein Clacol_003475 [Clathrus columnatus]